MKSIPAAMLWEMVRRGNWLYPVGFLCGIAMPIMMYRAFQMDGGMDSESPALLSIQMYFGQLCMFIFGAMAMSVQGPPARLFSHPIRVSELVAWQLFPVMVLVALEMFLTALIMNALFHADWPLLGPSLFAGVGVGAIMAISWITEKSAWLPFVMTFAATILGLWHKCRFGPLFESPTHAWNEVSIVEAATLALIAAVSYWVAIVGVTRNRCGEPPATIGLFQWLDRILERSQLDVPQFRSSTDALNWSNLENKGYAVPFSVALVHVIFLSGWVIFNRKPDELVKGLVVLGGLLSLIAGACSLIFGNIRRSDTTIEIGSFLASFPVTNTDMARSLLKTIAINAFSGWVIWAATFSIVYGILYSQGLVSTPFLPIEFGYWYFPATLVGSWTFLAVFSSIFLAGRSSLIVCLSGVFVATAIILNVIASVTLSHEGAKMLFQGIIVITAIGFVLGTIWLFVVARQGKMLAPRTISVSAGVWAIISMIVVLERIWNPAAPLPMYLFAIGIGALSVAPMAATPLALSWNRHR